MAGYLEKRFPGLTNTNAKKEIDEDCGWFPCLKSRIRSLIADSTEIG